MRAETGNDILRMARMTWMTWVTGGLAAVDRFTRGTLSRRSAYVFRCTVLAGFLAGSARGQVTVVSQAGGNWEDAGTWTGGLPHGNTVYIQAGHTVTMNGLATRTVHSLSITGVLEHALGTAHAVDLHIANDLTIAEGGSINVNFQGDSTSGFSVTRSGAGHGGRGGRSGQGAGGPTYGSITHPVTHGSRGGDVTYQGGGLVILSVEGNVAINGTITANGRPGSNPPTRGAGSGGSINLTIAGSMTMPATGGIHADGGDGTAEGSWDSAGGGGRIAIRLTTPDQTFDNIETGNITAFPGGGNRQAGAGTIFLKHADQDYGLLIVDGNDRVGEYTLVKDQVLRFDRIETRCGGQLAPGSGATLNLTGCTLASDSTTNAVAARVVIGLPDSQLIWPAAYTNHGTISWSGTNAVVCSGDLTVAAGGILTHEPNTTTEENKLFLSVTDDFNIASNGAIWVQGRGFQGTAGPGGGDGRAGGGHAGQGGSGHGTTVLADTYGSVTNPVTLGAGGRGSGTTPHGGGVVLLSVGEKLTVNGVVSANGITSPTYATCGGGAGGSVNIVAGTIAGTGTIAARGGRGGNGGGGGGGGRIAVRLLTGNAGQFAPLAFEAHGGERDSASYDSGAAGKIYLRGANQANGRLLIDNHDLPASAWGTAPIAATRINAEVADAEAGDVALVGNARLSVTDSRTLTVRGDWSNAVPAHAVTGGGAITFAGADTTTLYGSTHFANLICQVPGKTLRFEADTIQTVISGLTLAGAEGDLLTLESTHPLAQWTLTAQPGSTQHDVSYLAVSNSIAGGDTMTAIFSMDNGGNINWIFSNPADITWTGAISDDWNTPGNWDMGRVPLQGDPSITIPAAPGNQPVLDKTYLSPGYDGNLIIEPGASLNLNGYSPRIGGEVTMAGTLTASGGELISCESNVTLSGTFNAAQSTIRLAGNGPQTMTTGGNTFHILDMATVHPVTVTDSFTARDLTFLSTSAEIAFQGGFTVHDLRLVVANGASLTFGAGRNYTVNNLFMLRGTATDKIVLTASAAWNLNVAGYAVVRYVEVTSSDASGGRTLYAVDSIGHGSNPNWNFGAGTVWIGGDAAWDADANNWLPAGVPTVSSVAFIDGSAGVPRLTSGTIIAGLIVAGFDGPALMTLDMPFAGPDRLTVTGDADIGVNGIVTHTAGNETYRLALDTGGHLTVAAGGAINVTAKGYAAQQGPGAGSNRGGAGYGGQGGRDFQQLGVGTTYGSIAHPLRCGSGGGNSAGGRGGGVVFLTVSGAARLDGAIAADGGPAGNMGGGGSGGSIHLTADTLAGSGTVTVIGGNGVNGAGGGGGGRIVIRLLIRAASQLEDLTFLVHGGERGYYWPGVEQHGAAGTVYLLAAGDEHARVSIDNAGITTVSRTHIPPAVSPIPGELHDASIIVTNRGALAFTASDRIASLTVVSTNEAVNLGVAGTRLTVTGMLFPNDPPRPHGLRVNGSHYTRLGFYSATDWNGYSLIPPNVSGDGDIWLRAPDGSLFQIR